jgi:hypothetical protein
MKPRESAKPRITGTTHGLPFHKLSAGRRVVFQCKRVKEFGPDACHFWSGAELDAPTSW